MLLVLALLVPTSAAHAAVVAPASGGASQYTSMDFGFAEGAGIVDATMGQRLDGMRAFTGARAPLLRVDLDWAHVEPCQGCALQWDQLDPVVNQAAAKGIGVLLMLGYAPGWANGGNATDKWFPTRDADWTSIVDRTLAHLAGKVSLFEVWNEPNNEDFGDYATDRRQRYWQLSQLAYGHVHAACTSCVVLAGGSGNGTPANGADTPNDSAAWLQYAYDHGFSGTFDAVADHVYPPYNSGLGPADAECTIPAWNGFGPPDEVHPCGELAKLHKVMAAHSDTRKIWGTEWGYPTDNLPLTTVRDFMVQGVAMWRALSYTGPLFLYSYRDACADTTQEQCTFGVVDRGYTPKGVLYSDLSAAVAPQAELAAGQTLSQALWSLDGRFRLLLQGDGNLVIYRNADGHPIWSTGTTTGVRLVNQNDGNLVLYRADGVAVWSSKTYGKGPSSLWMQQDGNLVLYRNSDATVTWASHSAQ